MCLSKDDLMVVLGNDNLTAGFRASHQKDEALISKQMLRKAIWTVDQPDSKDDVEGCLAIYNVSETLFL